MPEWEFLTVGELAEILQLHRQTVRNWITAGELEAIKVGHGVRIPRKAAVKLTGGTGWEIPTLNTVDQVAERLRLNPQTVRNWIISGSLPAIYVGERRVRIKQSVVDELLATGLAGLEVDEGDRPAPTADDFWLGDRPVGAPVLDARAQGSRLLYIGVLAKCSGKEWILAPTPVLVAEASPFAARRSAGGRTAHRSDTRMGPSGLTADFR